MEPIAAQEVGGGAGTTPNTAQDGCTPLQPLLEREFSESVINALPGSFFVIGQDGRLVRWNRNFELLSGYSAPEVAAMHILDFVVAEHKERAANAMAKVLAEGGDEIEVGCSTKDGRARPLYVTGRRAAIGGTTCVIGTGFDITQRKHAEDQLRLRLRIQKLVAGISTDFVNLAAAEIGAGIDRALASIGRFAQADRSYIYMLHDNGTRMSRLYEWHAEGMDLQEGRRMNLEIDRLPWGIDRLVNSGSLNIPSVHNLQGQAAEAKELLESMGVEALLAVPISIAGQVFGFLGLSAVRQEQSWSSDTAGLLKTVAEIVANALERKRAANAMQERLSFETLLSDLSATFIHLPATEIDREIEHWLARIGEHLGLDRGTIVQFSGDAGEVRVTHAWAAPGLPRASASLEKHAFVWDLEQLSQGGVFVCARLEDIPQEAEREREYCRREGLKSVIGIPMAVAGSVFGIVAFSCLREQREWSDDVIQRLRLVGEIFTNALLRKRADESLRQSEEQFREIFENAVLGLYRTTPEGRVLMANPSLIRMLGYRCLEELAQYNVEKNGYQPGYSRAAFKELIESQGQVVGFESAWTKRDGTPLFIRENAHAVRGREGNILYYEGTVEDITERKRTERALTESEARFRELVELLPQTVFEMDVDGNFTFVNRAGVEMFGYAEQDVPRSNMLQMFATTDRERVRRNVRKKLAGEPFQDHEYTALRKDGRMFPVLLYSSPIVREAQRVGLRGIVLDISDRKHAEKSLQELQDIINRSPVLVFLWRVAPGIWPVEFVSDNVEQSLGYTADDFLSGRVSWPGITHPDDVPRLEAEVARYLEEGRREWCQEYRLIGKSGEVRWFTDQNLALADPDGAVTRIQSVVLDITERKRMEDALCESERKYRDLYEGNRDGTVAADLAGRILHCNSVFAGMLGYSGDEIAVLTYREIMPAPGRAEQDRIIREQVFARGYSDVYEEECVRKDGSVFPVEVRLHLSTDNAGRPMGMWALVRDITERKNAETQARQHLTELTRAWHANTIGEMASGLAHELNQPLCAILNYSNGCLRLSRREWFSIDTLQTSIEQIATQAQRAADIIKRIRGLIAKREPQRTTLDLESLVNDTIHMLQSEASRHHVAIAVTFARDLPAVRGDSVGIEQVLLNLMRNALEAMSDVDLTRRILTISGAPSDERYVEVAVTDGGRGVSPELAEKIFDSFFTTKDQGLGVGLSLSRRIVESHGGRLWVESDGCSGATFRLILPIEGAAHGEG